MGINMKEEKGRVFLQWLIPAICVIVVIAIMFFNFSNKTKLEAIETFEGDMTEIADRYALKINSDLQMMQKAGETVIQVIDDYKFSSPTVVQKLITSLAENTTAYEVIYCNEKGEGKNRNGREINLTEFSYYDAVNGVSEAKFLYLEDDHIKGVNAILLVLPSKKGKEGMLLLYYPMERIRNLTRMDAEFDSEAFVAMIDADGSILQTGEIKSPFLSGDNIWENMDAEYNNDVTKVKVRIQNFNSGCMAAVAGGEERTLVYAPVKINEWALMAGVNQSYVEKQEMRRWNNTSKMLYQLLGVIVIFFFALLTINVISKMSSAEKNKLLQEKADTDLLTGLNNKLATERKIKEYIEENPNSLAMMFVLDIDNFKKVNDTMGHAFGDEVLRSLGKKISSVFRVTDIVGRTGGDEFTIFLKFLKDDSNTLKEAQKLVNFFKDFVIGEYVKYSATASIGAAIFPAHGKDFETLYKSADKALYKAKKRGKNQLAFYDDRDRVQEEKTE